MHPRYPRSALAAALVPLFTLLAACGSTAPANNAPAIRPGASQSLAGSPGSTGTGTPMPSMSMPSASSVAAPAAPVRGHQVAIKNFAFAPAALAVTVGTTVTWTNQDTDAHTVTGGPLRSAALGTGQTYTYTFKTPGTFSYLCTIHPFMTAKVTVTK
jgi:plastocyanin